MDIPAYALKRLLNHKMIQSDVTAGYIVSDTDRLKALMEKISNFILELIEKNKKAAASENAAANQVPTSKVLIPTCGFTKILVQKYTIGHRAHCQHGE